jgi:hypothetical protein
MSITSEDCKAAIVDWTQLNRYLLTDQYGQDLAAGEDEHWDKIWNRDNWKRTDKRKEGDTIIRLFKCSPFDNLLVREAEELNAELEEYGSPKVEVTKLRLRGHVYTDKDDTQILSVTVRGESE